MASDIDWRAYKTNKELYGNLPCVSFKIQKIRTKLTGHLERPIKKYFVLD